MIEPQTKQTKPADTPVMIYMDSVPLYVAPTVVRIGCSFPYAGIPPSLTVFGVYTQDGEEFQADHWCNCGDMKRPMLAALVRRKTRERFWMCAVCRGLITYDHTSQCMPVNARHAAAHTFAAENPYTDLYGYPTQQIGRG